MREIKELKQKFDIIDIDGDEELSYEEFNIFLINIFGDIKDRDAIKI